MELPGELRQLEQIRRERQEWAADHYPVTEQGLLARFNPRTQSQPQASPAAQEHSQASFEPATVESPSSTQADPLLHKPPTSPQRATGVSSVEAHASPDPAAQAPVPATATDPRKQVFVNSPLSLGVGRGHTEVLMDTAGRGWPFGKESSTPALPALGRGFLLQMSQAQIPRESTGGMETPGRSRTLADAPAWHQC